MQRVILTLQPGCLADVRQKLERHGDVVRAEHPLTVPTGSGFAVAIVDSGIAPSDDFAGRVAAFYDFTRGDTKATAAYDEYGHGTHIAGLIGSSGRMSNNEFQGIAPTVRLVALKVLDSQGAGRTSDVARADLVRRMRQT